MDTFHMKGKEGNGNSRQIQGKKKKKKADE